MKLKEIADRVQTVIVEGEAIKLRLPPSDERVMLLGILTKDKDSNDNVKALSNFNIVVAKALKLCVLDHDDMTETDWLKLNSASGIEGLDELIKVVLNLCWIRTSDEEGSAAPVDAVTEAMESLGESTT